MTRRTYRGFTLIELLVVVGIIAIIIAILLPSLSMARETAKRARCGSQMAGIGKAARIYAADWSEKYPCQPAPYDMHGSWTYPTYANAVDGTDEDQLKELYTNYGDDATPFYLQMGDPAANMWLLVLKRYVPPASFVCPSDSTNPQPAAVSYSPPTFAASGVFGNFGAVGTKTDANTCSYSFTYPWALPRVEVTWWKSTTGGDVPLAADIGPSGISTKDDPTAAPGKPISNSKIHGGAGQNVLYFDAHVTFSKTNRAGANEDNIYTADGDNIYVATGGAGFSTTTNLDRMHANSGDVIMAPARP